MSNPVSIPRTSANSLPSSSVISPGAQLTTIGTAYPGAPSSLIDLPGPCSTYVYDRKTFTQYITDPFFDGTTTLVIDASTTTFTVGPQATAALWRRQQLNLPITDLEDTLQPLASLLAPILNPLSSALKPLVDPLASALDPVLQEIYTVGNPVITAVDPLVTPILSLLNPALSAVKPVISVADPALSIVVSALLPAITPVPSVLEPVASGVAHVITPVLSAAEPLITGILTPINSVVEPVESALLSLASPVVSLIQPIETAVVSPVAMVVSDLVGNITSIVYPVATPVLSAVLGEVTSLVIPPVVPIICDLVASDVEHDLLGLDAGCPQTRSVNDTSATTSASAGASQVAGSSPSSTISIYSGNSGRATATSSGPCISSTVTVIEIKTIFKDQGGQIIPATTTLTTSGCVNSTQTVYVIG